LIFEPPQGIHVQFIDATVEEEDIFSEVVKEVRQGEIIVQKRKVF